MVDFNKHLKAKLDKATKASSPSMVPTKPQVEKEPEPPPPDVSELPLTKSQVARIKVLIATIATANAAAKVAESKKAPAVEELKALLGAEVGEPFKALADDYRITYYQIAGRKTVNAQKLIQAGVPLATVTKCTDVGEPSMAIRVSAVAEEDQ